jgi:iron complex transport system ATP-binding protein
MIPALELEDASVVLGPRQALVGVSLKVMAGEVVGVVGANGSGKTTLLRSALGLARLSGGGARLGGTSVAELDELRRAGLAAYLPQERRAAWNMPAWRVAALGAPFAGPSNAKERAMAALTEVGLADLAERGVRDMSGGERARVLIARLLTTQAPLLVADEPAAGLDPDAALMVMDILAARARSGAAVLLTAHDLSAAARACHRLAVLKAGRTISEGAPEVALAPAVLLEAFGLDGGLVETAAGPVLAARRAK